MVHWNMAYLLNLNLRSFNNDDEVEDIGSGAGSCWVSVSDIAQITVAGEWETKLEGGRCTKGYVRHVIL